MKFFCKANLFACLAAVALVFAGCGGDSSSGGDEGDNYVSSVTVTSDASSIEAKGSTTLKAEATVVGSPTLTYTWNVTQGSEYASISGSGAQVTLNGTNNTSLNQTVKVQVSASDGTNTETATCSVIVNGDADAPALSSVTIGGSKQIEATGTSNLTADVSWTKTPSGNEEVSYVWEITKVDENTATSTDYATLSSSGKTATLTGKNTDENSNHVITVKVTATYDGKPVDNEFEIDILKVGEKVVHAVTEVSITPESASISAGGSSILAATVKGTGNPTLTYKWEITDGSEYATLLNAEGRASRAATVTLAEKYNTLTGKNNTNGDQTVTVKLTVNKDKSDERSDEMTITVKGNYVTAVTLAGASDVKAAGEIELTATPTNEGNPTVSYAWEITSGNDYAEIEGDGATVTLKGTNETEEAHEITVKVTATPKKAGSTDDVTETKTITVGAMSTELPVFPANGEESAYADTQLIIPFATTPVLAQGGTVKIYKASDNSVADTITINSSSANESQTAQSGYTINVGNNQLVRIGKESYGENPNSVYIQPHFGALEWGTEYYVVIEKSAITGAEKLEDGKTWNGFAKNAWSFTTKTDPGVKSTLTVSNATENNTADYFSVYGALSAVAEKSSGTYEIDIASGTYYELISVQGKGAHIILKGTGTSSSKPGDSVVIEYVNNVYMNNSTHTRPSFYFKGTSDLTFENVTLKNLTARNTSYTADGSHASSEYQAEALYYANTTGFLNAYNSSFISLQDTVCTGGNKAWFYGCYIAGDVDFMWGTSDVALFEKCDIACLNTSATTAYLFETRVGSNNSAYPTSSVGKGYVLFNSNITVDSGVTAYYARRASSYTTNEAKSTPVYYYDQAALVNVAFNSAPAAAHWYVGNEPKGVTSSLYGDYADVGWKEYNVTASGTAVSTSSRYTKSGVITSTEYTNEYSGRKTILNRLYNVADKAYAKDTMTNWDVESLITARGYSCDADSSSETLSGETEVTSVVYDFTSLTGYTAQSSYVSSVSPTTGTGSAVILGTNNFKWHGSQYGLTASGSSPYTITVPVTGACEIAITNSYTQGAPTVTLPTNVTGDTDFSVNTTHTYTYSGTSAANLTFSFASSSTFYISKIVVTYTGEAGGDDTDDGGDTATSVMWKADDYTEQTISSNTPLGIMTIEANSSNTVTVASSSATIDNVSFTKVVQLGGDGTPGTKRTLKFTASSAATITIYAGTAGGSGRKLMLTDGTNTYGQTEVSTSSAQTYVYSYTGTGGTLYIYSSSSGLNIYGVKIEYGSSNPATVSSVTISGNSSVLVGSTITLTATPNATPTGSYSWAVASGSSYVTLGSSTTNTVTVTGSTKGTATITATVDGVTSAAYTVTAVAASDIIISDGGQITNSDSTSRSETLTITKGETPSGYAGVGYTAPTYTNTVTVTSRADLVEKAKAGGYFIIVDGMIDMTDGMLPSVGGGTTSALDTFVNTNSSGAYTTYSAWQAAYAAACTLTTDDEKQDASLNSELYSMLWALSNAYKLKIQLVIGSNTAIVGKDASSGIKGATISISGVENVVLRNLLLQDAYDPFPHHEQKTATTSDGYNAQWDCITIQDSSSSTIKTNHIWIDHCTFEDTLTLAHVYTGGTQSDTYKEKWQTYDGLLDIKGHAQYVTVSYCKFRNHDKTSLVGSSDTEKTKIKSGSGTTEITVTNEIRLITYHHNYFYNCGQRLPMVRNTTMHLYNNYYHASSPAYNQQYAVGVRNGSVIYAENNYFTSGIYNSFKDSGSSSSSGTLHSTGNTDESSHKTSLTNTVQTDNFTAPSGYPSYTLETAATVQTNLPTAAGTGVVTIN